LPSLHYDDVDDDDDDDDDSNENPSWQDDPEEPDEHVH